MRRQDNPELTRKLLDHLAELYKIKERREPNHLSSYVYCRTRGFFDQKQAIEPTDQEVMLFAIGYGLQDVLTPKDAATPTFEKGGIIYSPDMVFIRAEVEMLMELKTTRKSAKKHYFDEAIPITWLEYMMGGCYIRETNRYDLAVLYMMGNYAPPFPLMYSDTFYFDDEELASNWAMLQERKAIFDVALVANRPPVPYQHCYDWECTYCRYKLVCETLVQVKAKEDEKLWD